jgi:hypothetical protein
MNLQHKRAAVAEQSGKIGRAKQECKCGMANKFAEHVNDPMSQ